MNRIDHTSALEKESYEAPLAIAFRLESRANILVGFSALDGGISDPEEGEGFDFDDTDYGYSHN
ncbi:hypothetical protein [uncultured Porphyromonas sp.]|jgi:hypothetical protein|uniref:hypothetical protein n=1 Tax=uncultured Porphyromonas sp. TaxID=159274 RepID=UPI002634376B|nr:hypothetical protein [uncultured Porphyromonas sp.]